MAAYSTEGRTVLVHLSDVPEKKRVAIADLLIRLDGLSGTKAMELKMAALVPTQNPSIEVPVAEARRVCGREIAP